ncbi:ABC transporter ATP-binding protein [Rhodobacteraceae bacterium F11138]|nr:ABC transporter ATP-binding protein [Rhodobacteraceae bacterium F11138]
MSNSHLEKPTTAGIHASAPLFEVRDLETVIHTRSGTVHAVNSVSFEINAGETLGVVGESGSGKSVTMMSLIRLLASPPVELRGGQVLLGGEDLLKLDEGALRDLRGKKVGFVFQDPMTSLNPVFTVGFQLMEPLRQHLGMSRRGAHDRAVELLALVGIPDPARRVDEYPHQFSGGMRQRVMIAMALACDPAVLIADEPTTALDVTIQAQIIELMRELQSKLGMAVIWVTHDLNVVREIADRVLVMYAGQVIEHGPVDALFAQPAHPYTRALLATMPRAGGAKQERLRAIEGMPPILTEAPQSCAFRARCGHARARCAQELPRRQPLSNGHDVACHYPLREVAEHV